MTHEEALKEALDHINRLVVALKPFTDFATNVGYDPELDTVAWGSSIHRESISTWFGPKDFAYALFAVNDTSSRLHSLSAPPAPARDEEIERLTRERDEWRKDFGTLSKAIAGATGLSAIDEAKRLKAAVAESHAAWQVCNDARNASRIRADPLQWQHNGNNYYCYCGVTDICWTASNTEEMAQMDGIRADRIRSALTVDSDRPATGKEENRTPVSNVMGSGLVLECLKDARSKLTDSSKIDLAYIDEVIGAAMQIGPPDTHLERIAAALKGLMSIVSDSVGVSGYEPGRVTTWDEFPEIEAARTVLPTMNLDEAHPDDIAVDRFAAAMKAKLAKKRDEGRGGWEDKDQCSQIFLTQLLRENVEKGDPINVGNFAMMLYQREERIASLLETLQGD